MNVKVWMSKEAGVPKGAGAAKAEATRNRALSAAEERQKAKKAKRTPDEGIEEPNFEDSDQEVCKPKKRHSTAPKKVIPPPANLDESSSDEYEAPSSEEEDDELDDDEASDNEEDETIAGHFQLEQAHVIKPKVVQERDGQSSNSKKSDSTKSKYIDVYKPQVVVNANQSGGVKQTTTSKCLESHQNE
ncbi:hypothetical protein V5O48_019214, partial [Marasmius crinis-equi]